MSIIAIILVVLAIISISLTIYAFKSADKHDEELQKTISKFQPRQMTDLSKPEAPKRKYYKRRNKKKKPAVAQNASVEKRPVGRPRKTTE
jgi:uncharacterized protein YxeA